MARLSKNSLSRLRRVVAKIEKGEKAGAVPARGGSLQPLIYLAESGGTGIAAMSGTTPGTADVTLKYIDSSGEVVDITTPAGDPITVKAYNVSSAAVAADTIIQLKQETYRGAFLVDFEDC